MAAGQNIGESIASLLTQLSTSLGGNNIAVNEALGDISHRLSGRMDTLEFPFLEGDSFDLCVAALGKRLSVCTTSAGLEVLPLIHTSISGLVEKFSHVDARYNDLSPWVKKLAHVADRLQRRKEMALILTIGFVAMASCTFPELCDVTIRPTSDSAAAGGNNDDDDSDDDDGDDYYHNSSGNEGEGGSDSDQVEEARTADETIVHHWDGQKTNNRELHRFIQTYEWGWRNLFSDIFLEEPRWKPIVGKTEVEYSDLAKVFKFGNRGRSAYISLCGDVGRELKKNKIGKDYPPQQVDETIAFDYIKIICEYTMMEEWKRHTQRACDNYAEADPEHVFFPGLSRKRKFCHGHAKLCPNNPDSGDMGASSKTKILGDGIEGDWRNGIEAAGRIRRPEEVANRAMKRIVKLGTRIVKVAEKEEKDVERRNNKNKKARLEAA